MCRDGFVDCVRETPTKGKYSVVALPLVSGYEDVYAATNMARYAKESHLSELHLSLITQVGQKVRILRGYQLRSPLAPEAGIRYDGV